MASASPAVPSRVAHSAAHPSAPPPPVDHHLCYIARGKYTIPAGVELFNQFSPRGFKPRIGAVAFHCNPVVKTPPAGKSFPITNPAAHLACLHMAAPVQPVRRVIVTNQFGTAELVPGQPNLFCLPAWKGLTGPPNHPAPQPPGLSHFTCYPVKLAPGTSPYNPPQGLTLQDQFAAKPIPVHVARVPSELCLPTKKVIGTAVTPIVNFAAHLLCFAVTRTPHAGRVWDQNQFGTSVISIGLTRWLCLPSSKRLIFPPVSHQLCYNGAAVHPFQIPANVKLINQFSPRGFVPKIGAAVLHCNPVVKILSQTGGRFPITNPRAHLLCFRMAATTPQPTPEVVVTNQFGSGILIPSQPNLLCLPSWKSLTGPPRRPAPQPPGLSHFTCYPVKELPGTSGYNPPPGILLRDEFVTQAVNVQVASVPVELCLPTTKVVGHQISKIVNPVLHLLCFGVTKTPIRPRVWDQNQFGTSAITINHTRWLCVPSTKKLFVPPPSG